MMTENRKEKRFISCPVCGRILLKSQGICNLEVNCGKCNSEIVVLVDEEKMIVLENRRGNNRTGQVKVSVPKNKPVKQMQPMKRAANY